MKLKKLAQVCKKTRCITIFEKTEEYVEQQYISDGCAVYPIYGLPVLDREALLTIFDIEHSKWDDWTVSRRAAPDSRYINLEDYDETEVPIRHLFPPVIYRDRQLMLCDLGDGEIMMVDSDYLEPVSDGVSREFYVRTGENGSKVLAVKDGLMLTAVILPMSLQHSDQVFELAGEFSRMGRALGNLAEKRRATEGEQTEL